MGEKQQRLNEAHESYIKGLLMRCKSEVEEVNEMVGFYGEPTLPPATAIASEGDPCVVKRLVCSPDFPVNDQEPIRCQICNKMYASRAAFTGHMKTHAKETEDPYRCNICSKTFAVPARLTRHYRTHTGEKPFRCEYCNKSFSVKENLSVHRRIHTKERPYKCEVCSRAFEHSGKLHRHMRIHTGERPHKCTVCSKTFIQSGQLVIHMRTHTGEKPYVCTVCQKGFTCSKQLKVHSRTHTGEKPYSCEICGKSFGYNHVLKLHQVAHYGEKVYKCTICNETFNSKKSMEAHIKSHSENGPSQPPTPPGSSASESSCTGSDLENFKLETSPPIALPQEQAGYDADIHYVLYTRNPRLSPVYPTTAAPTSGVELLAAAATVTERNEQYRPDVVFNLMRTNPVLRYPAYFASPPIEYPQLTSCDGLRKQVETVLQVVADPGEEEDPLLITPPSSNPVSPAPSLSPPASPVPDPELCLPPRKRSKRILRSMEATVEAADSSPVRYNSVIQYAKAS